jgi:hypothetical protein
LDTNGKSFKKNPLNNNNGFWREKHSWVGWRIWSPKLSAGCRRHFKHNSIRVR